MKTAFILIASILVITSPVYSEEITASITIGCPTIESYEKYLEVALSGDNTSTLKVAVALNCRMMQRGDIVKVIEWNMRKNLVRVMPTGNSMSYWVPGEHVSTENTKEPPKVEEFPKIHNDTILELEPIIVTLSDPTGNRYLKVTVAVDFESSKTIHSAINLSPTLKEIITMMLTSRSFDEINSREGKNEIKKEILERFNRVFRPERVKDVYFTEFIWQ